MEILFDQKQIGSIQIDRWAGDVILMTLSPGPLSIVSSNESPIAEIVGVAQVVGFAVDDGCAHSIGWDSVFKKLNLGDASKCSDVFRRLPSAVGFEGETEDLLESVFFIAYRSRKNLVFWLTGKRFDLIFSVTGLGEARFARTLQELYRENKCATKHDRAPENQEQLVDLAMLTNVIA